MVHTHGHRGEHAEHQTDLHDHEGPENATANMAGRNFLHSLCSISLASETIATSFIERSFSL
jgi:hypothetical protein